MRPRTRLSLIALLTGVPALAACEHGIDLQGKVSVPSDVQRMFSAQHPGELMVRAQIPGQPDITSPSVILCEPTGGERVIDVKVVKHGCASEATALVSAWVVPRTPQEVSCTAAPRASQPAEPLPSSALAAGRAVVSVDVATVADTGCKDGTISFALTLAPR